MRCFLGLAALQCGKLEDALAHFHWVEANGSPGLNQYAISLAELDRLDSEQAGGDGPATVSGLSGPAAALPSVRKNALHLCPLTTNNRIVKG